ncbi:uncharacterized protein AMSG_08124 [Thecamonas trahens ATCC 50062]|uniref:Carbohydrate kinase PfkB domain-containing protein n=1 Tax=Thecamonas trahens ATCC 50062 TaxID=461836 RepID=A0A0L0DJT1_THETB|nr:hypothetical protein AMSG_08124 [Thecamonas trahens ATCC 50062]KNC52557.1 hypothetical protein AMSG_08124 [Thecamonas trahens ATCC 50062]|eukprot:XP_013755347.1 hypothetical protein AMSG_08124 [Thecamonas trahens ATCC 50062]
MDSIEITYSPDVASALAAGLPVVALESTIVAHGMPYPENLVTAREVEATVKDAGAVPATIAIVDGVIKVGLTDSELERLAAMGPKVAKVSRRDVAAIVARAATGATTVAATSLIAARAGIAVFVTGGIGGVHRGGELSMDVSADLAELARTPVAVVCAGAKSILDIPRTLEVLETAGVPVIGYGTDEFPAFFTAHSGSAAPLRMDSPAEIARMVAASAALGLGGGAVIGVPIPDNAAADGAVIEAAISRALADADHRGITGRALTPFLLERVAHLTGGASLESNIALVLNNAKVGAAIACELAALRAKNSASAAGPLVVGGAGLDVVGTAGETGLVADSSAPGTISYAPGGVALNIASVLGRLGARPALLTRIGDDVPAHAVSRQLETCGVASELVTSVPGGRTGSYLAVLKSTGSLAYAVADMALVDGLDFDAAAVEAAYNGAPPPVIIADGNCSPRLLRAIGAYAAAHSLPLYFEPTSVAKAGRLGSAGPDFTAAVTCLTPNEAELVALAQSTPDFGATACPLAHLFRVCLRLEFVVVKAGARGALLAVRDANATDGYTSLVMPAEQLPASAIVDVTGAGDSLLAAFVWAIHTCGAEPARALALGQAAARLTLMAPSAVSEHLTRAAVEAAARASAL